MKNRQAFHLPPPRRRGFTLVELLAAIFIIAVLIAILFPAINKARKVAGVASMKFNFHTISDALENYKTDFGDYPRNGQALLDPVPDAVYPYSLYQATTSSNGTTYDQYRPALPRTDATLAMALIGPGPLATLGFVAPSYTQLNSSPNVDANGNLNGDADGADGSGFRTQMTPVASFSATASSGSKTINVSVSSSLLNNATPGLATLPPFTVASLGGPGSPDSHLQITAVSSSNISVATPIQGDYSSGTTVSLLAPTGKVWPAYLPIDKFKVAYIFTLPSPPQTKPPYNSVPYEPAYLPVLLDTWGNPILYFPAYNSYANQAVAGETALQAGIGDPTPFQPLATPITIGPLLGTPSSRIVPGTGKLAYQYNTPMSSTTTVPASSGVYTGPSIFWSGPLTTYGNTTNGVMGSWTTGQVAALLFKLGDKNGNNAIDNTNGYATPNGGVDSGSGESFAVQARFFMISAGPDGQFTDLYGGQPNPQTSASITDSIMVWQNIMAKSTNVYSFDP